ncbi:MAG TPA: 50S ribosomal protein L25 [Acidimicrobiales bacterium]|nr:50S ribosomal protein L25 [Acidimicrobiales bacterium]
MADITLVAEPGRPTGSRPARRQRSAGRIPAVVYGTGVDPVPVSVEARELRAALSTPAGLNAVLTLQIDGTSYPTMARELQRHPVRGTLQHVDFQVVDLSVETRAEVSITLVGDAVELHRSDGVVDHQLFTLTVRARPADIPANLELDISGLTVGDALRVSDIALPPGVATDLDPETVVVAGQASRVAAEAEAAGEAAAEEGAEAPPEGEARDTTSEPAGGGEEG